MCTSWHFECTYYLDVDVRTQQFKKQSTETIFIQSLERLFMIYRWAQIAYLTHSHCCVIEPDVGSITSINIYSPLSEGRARFGCVAQVIESWQGCRMKLLLISRGCSPGGGCESHWFLNGCNNKGLPPHSPEAHGIFKLCISANADGGRLSVSGALS